MTVTPDLMRIAGAISDANTNRTRWNELNRAASEGSQAAAYRIEESVNEARAALVALRAMSDGMIGAAIRGRSELKERGMFRTQETVAVAILTAAIDHVLGSKP